MGIAAPPLSPRETAKLLDLIEQRFGVRLETGRAEHLRDVAEHYREKRTIMRAQLGETAAMSAPDYTKAVFIGEAARLLLREIDPWPRRKKAKRREGSR